MVVDYLITLFLLSIICGMAVNSNTVGYMKQMKKNAVGCLAFISMVGHQVESRSLKIINNSHSRHNEISVLKFRV